MKMALKERIASILQKLPPELVKVIDNLDVIKDFIHLSHRIQPNPKQDIVAVVDAFDILVGQLKAQKSLTEVKALLNVPENAKVLASALTVAEYSLVGNIPPVKKVINERIQYIREQVNDGLSTPVKPDSKLVQTLLKDMEERKVISVPYKWTDAVYHERINFSFAVPQAKL